MNKARVVTLSMVVVSMIIGSLVFRYITTPLVVISGCDANVTDVGSKAVPTVVTFSEKFLPLRDGRVKSGSADAPMPVDGASLQRVPLAADSGLGMVARLSKILPVDTTFGGAFVARIGGLSQTSLEGSWFYYVDGVLSNRGFAEFRPEAVRHIRWDLHPTEHHTVSALVGDYPLPFTSQYADLKKNVEIYYLPPHELVAESFRTDLGRRGVAAKMLQMGDAVEGMSLSNNSHKILIGRVDELAGMAAVSSLLNDKEKSGVRVDWVQGYPLCIERWHSGERSSEDSGQPRDDHGSSADCITEGAAILALAQPVNMAALWVVTGIGDDDLKRVVESLIAGRLSDTAVAWVKGNGDVINLPRE